MITKFMQPLVVVCDFGHNHMSNPSIDASLFENIQEGKVIILVHTCETWIEFCIHCLYIQ